MNILRRTTIWGWMIFWGLTMGQGTLLHAAFADIPYPVSTRPTARTESLDREMDRFFKAKEHVFKYKWEEARRGFESYLEDYPKGQFRDEGLYWLANSLNMLSKSEKTEEKIVEFKEAAVVRINELIENHPKSMWRDDGMALRIEIASQLILMGQERYAPIIEEAARTQKKDVRRLRMLALNALIGLDADYVRPLLENILKTDEDSQIRKQCVQLLGSHFPDGSLDLLQKIAAEDKDAQIQKEAQSWIDRITRASIPVYMKYNIYGSRLVDESLNDEFPEGKVRTIPLKVEVPLESRNMMDLVRTVFNGKLSTLSSSANGVIPYPGFFLQEQFTIMTNRAGDYQLWIKPDELDVTEDRITGVVEFRHRKTNEKQDVSFQLNRGETKLLSTRSGNIISLMIIQFREWAAEEGRTGKGGLPDRLTINAEKSALSKEWGLLAKIFGKGDRDSYNTTFNVMEWTVHSTRKNWSLEDITAKTGKYDFGEAEAVSTHPEGWKLTGNLLLMIKEKRFIGRDAILLDPKGKTAAVGNEIIVPVDNPENFEVKGARRIEQAESELPDYGPLEAQAVFQIEPNLEIQTDRKYFSLEEFNRNLIGFGRSKAQIPERSSSSPEKKTDAYARFLTSSRKWALIGDIFWIKNQNRLIGFGALVINPDRELKAQGLISIPLDDPAGYRVLQGKSWKKKEIIEQADERNTRYYYPCQISDVHGWVVLTTLNSSPPPIRGGKNDYSLAQATRTHDGKVWILMGHILYLQKEKTFLARQAALINSDGDIVYGSEIEVPADNPSGAKIIMR
jgi:hypothetical protein